MGVFVWAPAPFFGFCCVFCFASLFPLAKRKSGWGICGSSFFVWLWFSVLLLQSICRLQGPFVLVQCIFCLLSCKDRAISATSATLEGKKNLTEEGLSEILSTARGVRTFVGLGLCLSKRRLDGWLSCRYCRTNKRRTYCFRCGSTS